MFTPTYEGKDYCLQEFIENTKKIKYPGLRHIWIDNSATEDYTNKLKSLGLEAYWVKRGNNSRESLARAQTLARLMAIKENYDYLFSLESDIFAPPETIYGLLRWGVDCVTGLYYIGDKSQGVQVPCITMPELQEHKKWFGTRLLKPHEFPSYFHQGLKQVAAGGMGCCLLSRKVFEKHGFTYDPRYRGHSDVYLFNMLFRVGIPVYVDTNLVCDHQNSSWEEVKDR